MSDIIDDVIKAKTTRIDLVDGSTYFTDLTVEETIELINRESPPAILEIFWYAVSGERLEASLYIPEMGKVVTIRGAADQARTTGNSDSF